LSDKICISNIGMVKKTIYHRTRMLKLRAERLSGLFMIF
jgi:hypothetical protein